ncbi:MAG: DUF3192 domain-containing protein [bacterium]
MHKILSALIICFSLTLCSCVGGLDTFRDNNRKNILKLSIGMLKSDVDRIMGHNSDSGNEVYKAKFVGAIKVSNPYKSEILKGKDIIFEVWYYYTDLKSDDGAITDDELMPIVFEDGKLIGWGQSFLGDMVHRYEIRFR